ncbi:MAG: hypothetical protein AAGA48_03705 [Myxococcota bacterium]
MVHGARWALLLGIAAGPGTAWAGAWVPERGHGYVKTWTKWHWGFLDYVDGNGDILPFGAYHEVFQSTYGEVGIGAGLAVTWHTDLVRFFVLGNPRDGSRQRHLAPGDPRLGLRVRLLRTGRFVMAADAGLRAPLAPDMPVQDVFAREPPMPQIGELRVGAGIFEADAGVRAGFGWKKGYLASSLGWELRGGRFDDRLLWSVEGGTQFGRRVGTRLRASGVHSVRSEGLPAAEGPSGIGNGTSWTGLAVEADVALGRLDGPVRWALGLTEETGITLVRRRSGGLTTSLNLSASLSPRGSSGPR